MNANVKNLDDTMVEVVHRDPEARACVPDVIALRAGETLIAAGEEVKTLYSLEAGRVMITCLTGARNAKLSDLPPSIEFAAVKGVEGRQRENKPVLGAYAYFRRAPSPWTFTAIEDSVVRLVHSSVLAEAYESLELPAVIDQMMHDSDISFELLPMVIDRLNWPVWRDMTLDEFMDVRDQLLEQDPGGAWNAYVKALMAVFRELVDRRNAGVPFEEQSLVTDVEALHFHRNRRPGR